MSLPLTGITVVALEHAVAAPFCTRQLADQGARVIKIERPGSGDFARSYDQRAQGLCSHFVWTNRSKESLTLDLKHPRAAEILERLIGRADVLVQNFAPGAAARLGLAYQTLAARHPALIVCNISGYGDEPTRPGPYRDKKAYDLMIQSESGFLSVTGSEGALAKAGSSIADIAAGMYAYTNVLTALIARGRTGRGRCIDLSMLEAMVEWMGYPLYYAYDGAPPPPRAGAAHSTICPYGPFPAGDGGTVMVGVQNQREWQIFCSRVLEQPALAVDPRFVDIGARNAARGELHAIISAAFAKLDTAQLIARLENAGIACARVNELRQVWEHAQLAARQRWVEIDTPAGPLRAPLPPGARDAASVRMDAVPALGQHSDAILTELGYDAVQLRAEGVV